MTTTTTDPGNIASRLALSATDVSTNTTNIATNTTAIAALVVTKPPVFTGASIGKVLTVVDVGAGVPGLAWV